MNKRIYLDAAATTYVNNEVINAMMPVLTNTFGNSNSLHSFGREAMAALDEARSFIASTIGAKAKEIYFTSSGTEANNWAIRGLAYANINRGKHIITSKIEHDSILKQCKQLEKEGFKVTYLPVDKHGLVSLSELMHNLRPDTTLVSIMAANNEVGTIQHLNAIARTVKEKNVLLHMDCVQAYGAVGINVDDLNLDALTISSHKIYGPKGAAALYVRDGINIANMIYGGSQEYGKRPGTVDVANIVGFAKACEIATRDIASTSLKLRTLREFFTKEVQERIPNVHINGHLTQRLPNLVNISFDCVDGESLMTLLDLNGIAVSRGSACTSGSTEPSHVLKAMGFDNERAKSAIRFSIPKNVTKEDLNYVVDVLEKCVKKLREISALNKPSNKEAKNV